MSEHEAETMRENGGGESRGVSGWSGSVLNF